MKKKIKAVGFLGQRKKTGFWYTFSGSLAEILESQPSYQKLFVFWYATLTQSLFGLQLDSTFEPMLIYAE
jgi:hypothetical protein